MRSRGSVGNDSRVSVADWVSMAAILPGPVQAWPRPGPAQTPPPAATARAAPQSLVQVCYVTAGTAPPTGRAEGRLPAAPAPRAQRRCGGTPLQLGSVFLHAARAPQASPVLPITSPALSPPIPILKLAQPVTLSVCSKSSAWLYPRTRNFTSGILEARPQISP